MWFDSGTRVDVADQMGVIGGLAAFELRPKNRSMGDAREADEQDPRARNSSCDKSHTDRGKGRFLQC
jgi:hypothetical protein